MNVAVIGLGKLGLPLACLQAKNHRVFGIDSNAETVSSVNRAVSPIREPGVDPLLKFLVGGGKLSAHTDYSVVADTEISFVIVPTPSLSDGSFTSEYVVDAVRKIGEAVKGRNRRHVVVVCSTVMPGECDTAIRDALEEGAGEALGQWLALLYSPEFIALGSVLHDMENPDVTIIGFEQLWALDLYREFLPKGAKDKPVLGMSWVSAEIAKIALNSYVTMKIAFANTLGELCEKYPGANAHFIAQALGADERVGHKYISPGGPFGGPCFPRDSRAFSRVGARVGQEMLLAQSVDQVNDHQIDRMVEKVLSYGREIVGILGLTYKPGAPIMEESFGKKLVDRFVNVPGIRVRVYDPLIGSGGLPPGVAWFTDVEGCCGNDTVTILTNPDPAIIKHLPEAFEKPAKSKSVLLDPWDCVPDGPWHDSHIVTLGRGL